MDTADPDRRTAASSTTTAQLAQRFVAALHAVEHQGHPAVDVMVGLFAELSTLTNPALEQAGTHRAGRAGAHAFWSNYADAFAGASTTFRRVTLGDRAVGLFWETAGGPKATGGELAGYAGATLIEHDDDGLITSFRGYYDTQALK